MEVGQRPRLARLLSIHHRRSFPSVDQSWRWLLKRLLWSTLSTGLGPRRPMVVVKVGDVAWSAAGAGRPKELAAVGVPVATPPSRTRRCCRVALRSPWCSGFRWPPVAREELVTPRQ